jgi:transposase
MSCLITMSQKELHRLELIKKIRERSLSVVQAAALLGAEHGAIIASLVETAKLNDVEPLANLVDVLSRIVNGHPNSQLDDLLPWAYAARHEAKAAA